MSRIGKAALLLLAFVTLGQAHIGSPDIYVDGNAGPYRLFVTIRPPQVIPGVAQVEVRAEAAGIREMSVTPLSLGQTGEQNAPTPDLLRRSNTDPQFFAGALWLMTDGSSQVRIKVEGAQGSGVLAVPVAAVARTTRSMQWQLGVILSVLGLFLVGGITAICGAAVREAKLPEGLAPAPLQVRRGRIAMAAAFGVIALVLWGGKSWWDSDAAVYRDRIYKPLNMQADLQEKTLTLKLSEPGWMQAQPNRVTRILFIRKMDDLVPDHDHLMHLYAIREPALDVIYHLHPDQSGPDDFRLQLPNMPPGEYQLYADVVHANGLPETLTARLALPQGIAASRPLAGDDAAAETEPVSQATLGGSFVLPDGYRMRWLRDAMPLHAEEGREFRFELLTPAGNKPKDMALYMGMVGHAAFVKDDGSVFAHIHPNGTVSMAAFMLAQNKSDPMAGMNMNMDSSIPNEVAFPYGLPVPGKFRIFVQMKHGTTVETGVFDAAAQ